MSEGEEVHVGSRAARWAFGGGKGKWGYAHVSNAAFSKRGLTFTSRSIHVPQTPQVRPNRK